MENKRIAFISYHTCPLSEEEGNEVGGMNVYVLELSKELSKRGYFIDIFTRSQSPDSRRIVTINNNLRVIHLLAGPQKPIEKNELKTFINEFTENFIAFKEKESISYDILNCHYYLSGLIGIAIKKELKSNIPLVITFHTLAIMKNLVARSISEQEDIARIDAELELVKKAQKVIATSNADKAYLENLYNCPKNKIAVVIPGVDNKLFSQIDKNTAKEKIGASKTDKIILFVGRLEPLKGIDVLLYAMKILLKNNFDFKVCLWIVGGDIKKENSNYSLEINKIEEIKKLLNISTVVKAVGSKKRIDLPYYYNSAELVVMPSQYESFGMSALEAMSCAIPVITTDATGVSGIFDKKHSYLITSANNPLSLANKMAHLLKNENDYKKLKKEVFVTAQGLNWSNTADKFIDIFKHCRC